MQLEEVSETKYSTTAYQTTIMSFIYFLYQKDVPNAAQSPL